MLRLLKDVWNHRELLSILVQRNIKIRYKNSMLGFFWSLLAPLFLIAIYAVFLGVMKFEIPLPFLVTGIVVWQFLSMCLGDSPSTVVGSASLVTKTVFPRVILPLAMVIANLINFLLSFAVLFVYLLIVQISFGPLYWLPCVVLSQFALCLGMALIFSCANVFFRDTEHILSVLMLAWFFMSPVIYPLEYVTERFPKWMLWIYFANPMAGIVSAYRRACLSAALPDDRLLILSFITAWMILGLGLWVFQKFQARFGEEL